MQIILSRATVGAALLAVLNPAYAAFNILNLAEATDFEMADSGTVSYSLQDDEFDSSTTIDPWESWNRKVYSFNSTVDKYFLKPVAKSYRWVTPDPIEFMVNNFFSNLNDFTVTVNDILQADFKQTANDGGRFIINSTLGFAGLFDVAQTMGLEKNYEDFGTTLAAWGADSGPFLMLPLFGPSTVRDGIGFGVDRGFINILPNHIDDVPVRNSLTTLQIVSIRARLLDAENFMTGDQYIFMRDAYLSRRNQIIHGYTEHPDSSFGDQDFGEDW